MKTKTVIKRTIFGVGVATLVVSIPGLTLVVWDRIDRALERHRWNQRMRVRNAEINRRAKSLADTWPRPTFYRQEEN